jgi:hypothetical protein
MSKLDPDDTAFLETVVFPRNDELGVNAQATEAKEATATIENFIFLLVSANTKLGGYAERLKMCGIWYHYSMTKGFASTKLMPSLLGQVRSFLLYSRSVRSSKRNFNFAAYEGILTLEDR